MVEEKEFIEIYNYYEEYSPYQRNILIIGNWHKGGKSNIDPGNQLINNEKYSRDVNFL